MEVEIDRAAIEHTQRYIARVEENLKKLNNNDTSCVSE
jgi:hypothetical protein